MATVEETKEVLEKGKEVATASGDIVDKVFSHLDTYFKAVADALTSEQAKEFGKSVIDTGLTGVQVDATIYVVSWFFALIGLAIAAYVSYRVLFDKLPPLSEEEREYAKERVVSLENRGYGGRSTSRSRNDTIRSVWRGMPPIISWEEPNRFVT